MPIDTVEDLREHIELAIQVELSTIPPYLFAMYSIEDPGSEAALLIKSIVAEEMLHAVLAANLLLAVGGRPDFSSTAYMPRYPCDLPHHRPPLLLELAPCSRHLIESVFMRIEQPEVHGAPDQPDMFETLGQFYHALEVGLRRLSASESLFANPQLESQVGDPAYYSPVQFDADDSGGLMMIDDLDSAIEAIEVIIHQGEGLSDERWADPSHQELTHYYKLKRIMDVPGELGSVRPVRRNPIGSDYPEEIQPVSDLFNVAYRYLYLLMAELFAPGFDRPEGIGRLYGLMSGVLSPLARYMVTLELDDGQFAGPTFEVFDFDVSDARSKTLALASDVRDAHPDLATVVDSMEALVP